MIAALVALAVAAAPVPLEVAHRQVRAADGASLALYRYAPPGRGAGRPPVLLLADFGFGRDAFDFHGEGLARWLAARGWLVYVGEVRGQGHAGPGGDSLEPIARLDVPALLAAVGEPADLVVEGWVGSLALASTVREARGRVRRVVALDVPSSFAPPSALAEAFLLDGGRFSTLSSSPDGARAFSLLFAMGGDFPRGTLEGLRATGTRDLSSGQARALLAWMRLGDLPLGAGSVRERLAGYERPTLALLGLADGMSGPELCGTLREVSKARVAVRTFSRFEDPEDYSHLSLLLGRSAPRAVFPAIADFLSAAEAPR